MKSYSDKELIELAAKAVGFEIEGWYCEGGPGFNASVSNKAFGWNPLTHAGDAMELAVLLNMRLEINQDYTTAIVDVACPQEQHADSTPLKATCRAITRAAAVVGSRTI